MDGRFLYTLLLPLLLTVVSAKGQSQDSTRAVSLHSFYLMPVLNPWLITDNPAGLSQNKALFPGEIKLGFSGETGDYKRVQQGNDITHYSFQTGQYKKINSTSFYGHFSYDKSFEKGLIYSDVNNPYRGTPYLLIDTIRINNNIYDREFFSLNGAFSIPLTKKISYGMATDFKVGLSAQNRDPRPKNKVLNIFVSPGVLFSASKLKVGLNLIYGYYNEDIGVTIVKENIHMTFFSLHGLGTSVYHAAASYARLYKQNKFGVNTQVNYQSGQVSSLLGAKLIFMRETTNDGRGEGNASWAHIKNCAELKGINVEVYHTTVIKTITSIHRLLANLDIRNMLGTEIIQRLENDPNQNYMENWVTYGKDEKYSSFLLTAKLSYSFIKLKDEFQPNYILDWEIRYLNYNQAYYIPNQKEDYKNLILSLNFDKSFYFRKSVFSISAVFQYKRNLYGTLNLEDNNFIIKKLTAPDFNYLTSNYVVPGAGLSYEIPLKKLKSKYFIKSRVDLYRVNSGKTRTVFNFSTGVIF